MLPDLPVTGRLFTSDSVDATTTNLLIFVTARTVDTEGATPEEVFCPAALQATEYLPSPRPAPAPWWKKGK